MLNIPSENFFHLQLHLEKNELQYVSACVNGYITDIIGVDKEDVVVFDGSQYCHFNESGCEWQVKLLLEYQMSFGR